MNHHLDYIMLLSLISVSIEPKIRTNNIRCQMQRLCIYAPINKRPQFSSRNNCAYCSHKYKKKKFSKKIYHTYLTVMVPR